MQDVKYVELNQKYLYISFYFKIVVF